MYKYDNNIIHNNMNMIMVAHIKIMLNSGESTA